MSIATVYILISFLSSIRAKQSISILEVNSELTISKQSTYRYPNDKEMLYKELIIAPIGYNVRLKCRYVELSEDRFCSNERIMISKYGDDKLFTGNTFCNQPFEITSVGNKMTFAYLSTVTKYYPNNGFSCSVMPELAAPPPCKCGELQSNKTSRKSDAELQPKPTENNQSWVVGISRRNEAYCRCFGAVINPQLIVVAASCVYLWNAEDMEIITEPITGLASPKMKVIRYIIHDHFLDLVGSGNHDIAVLETQEKFDSFACLPYRFASYDLSGTNVIAFAQATCSNQTLREFKKESLRIENLYIKTSQTIRLTSNCNGVHPSGPIILADGLTKRAYIVGIIGKMSFREQTGTGYINNFYDYLDWIKRVTLTKYCGEK